MVRDCGGAPSSCFHMLTRRISFRFVSFRFDAGDVLDILEWRHDWASFVFTWDLFKYVFLKMLPEVVMHSQSQDEEQVRDHYDRGDDFYAWYVRW